MRALAFCLLALVLATAPVRAEESPDVEALISRQLDAFARDDAEAAFDFATAAIRARFRNPAVFLAMVKSAYPAVYRHRSVQFSGSARQGDEIRQGVVFVDADNDVWNGVYLIARQVDGAWKIAGCALQRSDETSL